MIGSYLEHEIGENMEYEVGSSEQLTFQERNICVSTKMRARTDKGYCRHVERNIIIGKVHGMMEGDMGQECK